MVTQVTNLSVLLTAFDWFLSLWHVFPGGWVTTPVRSTHWRLRKKRRYPVTGLYISYLFYCKYRSQKLSCYRERWSIKYINYSNRDLRLKLKSLQDTVEDLEYNLENSERKKTEVHHKHDQTIKLEVGTIIFLWSPDLFDQQTDKCLLLQMKVNVLAH